MDQQELTRALIQLTGTLTPSATANAAQLQTARMAVANTLLQGKTVAPSVSTAIAQDAEIEKLAGDAIAQSPTALPDLAFVRSAPARSAIDPATPPWARGMAVARSIGPFTNEAGHPVWIDLIPPLKNAPVRFAAAAQPFAVLPLAPGTVGQHTVPLRAGTVWFLAKLLAPTAPAGAWTGFRIKSRKLTVAGFTMLGGQMVLQGVECTLDAVLDPPPAPASVTGPGADATDAKVALPPTVTIRFTPANATITQLPEFGATIYNDAFRIEKNATTPLYDGASQQILVTGDLAGGAAAPFTVGASKSDLFIVKGSAHIELAAWALPVAQTAANQLGEAAGAGAGALMLSTGIAARWPGSDKTTAFAGVLLQAVPGEIAMFATIGARPVLETFALWEERLLPSGKAVFSTVDFLIPSAAKLLYAAGIFQGAGIEFIEASGALTAHTDRPQQVNGLRIPMQAPNAFVLIGETASGTTLFVGGAAAQSASKLTIALENALLQVSATNSINLRGTLNQAQVEKGTFNFNFHLIGLVPTLPDPYATSLNSSFGEGGIGRNGGDLRATVSWPTPPKPKLQFALIAPQSQANASLVGSLATRGAAPRLLDVSSRLDQLGVAFAPRQLSDLSMIDLALAGKGDAMALFTVSEVSWEPMSSTDPIPTPPTDGVPTTVQVPTVQFTPIQPKILLDRQIEAVKRGDAVSVATALPFGMIAGIDTSKNPPGIGEFDLNQPEFPGLSGGLQLTLAPPSATKDDALFGGSTSLTAPYGEAVLGADVSTIFKQQFDNGGGVPLKRYDLSGYGASVFSEWAKFDAQGPAIIKAQFNVFVGRTALEVVQAQSMIYPWGIKVVRTITMERHDGGAVVRVDSGWQAATPGIFQFPSLQTPNEFIGTVHPGAVKGIFNVRRIRDNGAQATIGGVIYAPVLFDGDFDLNPQNKIVAGGFNGEFVPSADVAGYLQLGPMQLVPIPGMPGQFAHVPVPVTRPQLGALLNQTGPVGGPMACTVSVGSTGQNMIGTQADVSVAAFNDSPSNPTFVAALGGTPVLPRDGAWSVGRKIAGSLNAPVALDPHFAVPLVQPNGDKRWHLAEPGDILHLDNAAQVAVQYGLLQATGTQKVFFARPQIPQAGSVPIPAIHVPDPPHLADVGALLNATGIFPDLSSALQFPAGSQNLGIGNDGLKISIPDPGFPITASPRTLVDFGPVKVVLDYTGATAIVDIDPLKNPRWAITLKGLNFVLVSPYGDANDPLIKVVGTAKADSNTAPTLSDLNVVYGSIMKLVQQIFSRLQELAKFLPGGQKLAGLDVHFSDGKLTIRDSFALPTLPLGIGDITDVALDLGTSIQLSPKTLEFTAGIGSEQKPFHWLVSPLSGTGCVEVGFRNNVPTLLVQAGIGVGLAIDVAIASGSASIVIALQVDNKVSPFEVKAILTGQASVDVLDGLASASLTLSAGLGIVPVLVNPPEITLIGSVGVGIHISICWVVNIDFDGYWQFSQTFTSPVSVPGI